MPVSVGIMLPSRETAMTGLHDARGLIAFARAAEDAGIRLGVGGGLTARADACGAVVSPCRRRGGDDTCGAGYRCVDRVAAASSAGGGAGGDHRPALSWPTDPRARLGCFAAGEPPRIRRGRNGVLGSRRAARQDGSRCGARHGTGKANSPMHCRRRDGAVRRSGSLVATRRKSSNASRPPMTVGCRICRT